MKRIFYFAVIWMCISTVGHAMQPAPETIAESEKTLFGKLKLWEIEKISPYLYTYRYTCLLHTSPSPRDATLLRMPSSA